VFHEWGFGGKLISNDGAAFLRGTNGSVPVRLAPGSPLAVSPDGKSVIISNDSLLEMPRIQLFPTGAGEPTALPDGAIRQSYDAWWFPDDPVDGGERRPIPGLESDECVLRLRVDGHHVFVTERNFPLMPTPPFRLDLESGRRESWKELSPADSAGVQNLVWVCLTPDGRSYAYSYFRKLSVLYLVERVR